MPIVDEQRISGDGGGNGQWGWIIPAALVMVVVMLIVMALRRHQKPLIITHNPPPTQTRSRPAPPRPARPARRAPVRARPAPAAAPKPKPILPMDAGPLVAETNADIFQFAFWPCRRFAGAVVCKGLMRNEYTGWAYQPLVFANVKDDLGNEYAPQEFIENGQNCSNGCTPQFKPRGSQKLVLTVDGVVGPAKSLTMSFRLMRSSLAESYVRSVNMDASITVPIAGQ